MGIESSFLKLFSDQIDSYLNGYLILLEQFNNPGFFVNYVEVRLNSWCGSSLFPLANGKLSTMKLGWPQPKCLIFPIAVEILDDPSLYWTMKKACKAYNYSINVHEDLLAKAPKLPEKMDALLKETLTDVKYTKRKHYDVLTFFVAAYFKAETSAEKIAVLKEIIDKLKGGYD